MQIGERLRIAREAVGLTLKQAAKKAGIRALLLRDFENGKSEPKCSCLNKLADIYSKPLEFFFAESLPPTDLMLWCGFKPEQAEPSQGRTS